jgi:hypothetical protein
MLASMVSILVEPAASIFEPLTDPQAEENQACAEHMVKAAVVESSGFAPGTFDRTPSTWSGAVAAPARSVFLEGGDTA